MGFLASLCASPDLTLKYDVTYGDRDVKSLLAVLTLLIVTTGCYAAQLSEEESEKKDIEFCRKTVTDQDNDAGLTVFTAACEDMEEDFKKKHGYTP